MAAIPTITIKKENGTVFEVEFKGLDRNENGVVVLTNPQPQSDTDLLRRLVEEVAKVRSAPSVGQQRAAVARRLSSFLSGILNARDDVLIRGRFWTHGDIRPALEGQPDKALSELPTVNTKLAHRRTVKYDGFAEFNGGPHLEVDVPNGNFTITCKTSEGRLITFAFIPYQEDGPAKCVDVLHHTSGVTFANGNRDCPVQEVIAFTVGRDLARSSLKDDKPCTLLTVLLQAKEEADAKK